MLRFHSLNMPHYMNAWFDTTLNVPWVITHPEEQRQVNLETHRRKSFT